MKIYILLIALSFSVTATTPKKAFKNFYDSEQISSIHCGVNIQLFLKYLEDNDISFTEGRVVSIHNDYAYLNHFDARWGNEEFYENKKRYFRSNWYFHVFLILDGYAYDFSQRSKKPLKLQSYLRLSYFPKSVTQKIFIQGKLSKKTEYNKYKTMEMNFYRIQDYVLDTGGKYYSGYFSELFQ